MRSSDQRVAGPRAEVASTNEVIDLADQRATMLEFDDVWDALFPAERCRIERLPIEQVSYDAEQETVAITYRSGAPHALPGDTHPPAEHEDAMSQPERPFTPAYRSAAVRPMRDHRVMTPLRPPLANRRHRSKLTEMTTVANWTFAACVAVGAGSPDGER